MCPFVLLAVFKSVQERGRFFVDLHSSAPAAGWRSRWKGRRFAVTPLGTYATGAPPRDKGALPPAPTYHMPSEKTPLLGVNGSAGDPGDQLADLRSEETESDPAGRGRLFIYGQRQADAPLGLPERRASLT
ncbi:hypothetical protein SKAU_G00030810 [Synaphobranchus kaupii]|uniref:Uncharacterized protein n=1 Tax=Synaphobranchus kaupii TaxID=118154 RepID=A0A9Q1JE37_SYNKA|nr:hypothetical protein SKAU_G00030810 [Synaphobranchus kaupii]